VEHVPSSKPEVQSPVLPKSKSKTLREVCIKKHSSSLKRLSFRKRSLMTGQETAGDCAEGRNQVG
jgi:hypothetical protein